MALKLGMCNIQYIYRFTLEEALDRIARHGFKYLNFLSFPYCWPRNLSASARKDLKRQFSSRGLEIVSLDWLFTEINLASPNPGLRGESIRQMKENIELAIELEAKVLVIMAGKSVGLIPVPFEEMWKLSKGAIQECLDLIGNNDLTLGLENGPYALLNDSSSLIRMVQEIGSEKCRILFDVGNANIKENPTAGIKKIGKYLCLVHLSDNDGKTFAHLPVGMGNIDFQSVADVLRKINYTGVSIFEPTYERATENDIVDSKEKLEKMGWKA
jgi:sugar phosphate isomerase/epimerase